MQPILDIADLGHRREAAEATASGAALFYAFGNFCALAARPDLESLGAMNALKGRPLQREFGERAGVVLIGHRDERANRRLYPHHVPCSTSIVALHEGELV